MATYQVGQTLAFGLKVRDEAGALADLGNGLPTATLTAPDGTIVIGAVAKTATGTYTANAAASQAGRWKVLWEGSGANSGGLPYPDQADVWPTDPRFIIGLADARAALNLPPSAVTDDDELRLYIAATTAVIENIAGPILATQRTEVLDGTGAYALFLSAYPGSVVSVVEDGVTLGSDTTRLGAGGVLWRLNGAWSTRPGSLTVTYTVGGSSVPPNVVLAAREQLRHMWQIGQLAARPALGGDVAPGYTPTGYAVPNRVVQLLSDQVGTRAPVGLG